MLPRWSSRRRACASTRSRWVRRHADVLCRNHEIERRFRAAHPLGRVAQPEEAASLVAYLAGDDASFITGAIRNMDGGWTAH
ncbi:SDR family oxidoreductase [Pseudonocardia alaniniphila]|uniref:SDR family oxidoreductase n=1 Tax=Pseudonocardia alaniniphila TaxID=75291 RepID=UPI00362E763A